MLTPAELISIRLALGLTQTGIAQLLQLGPNGGRMVRRFESGREIPPGPVLLLYALARDGRLPEAMVDRDVTRNNPRTIARQIEDTERRLNMALAEARTAEARRDAALTAASVAEKRRQTADQTVERMTEAFTAAVGLIADGVAWPRDKPGEWLEGLRFPLEQDRWHEFQSRYGSGIAWVVVWAALKRFTAAVVAAEERLIPEPPQE
ncbi:MAG: hypothetical protein OXI46_11315 [Gemmatimonadota bacterium]|nr:hypothetical protein [Gemmatimonadota bacterium]